MSVREGPWIVHSEEAGSHRRPVSPIRSGERLAGLYLRHNGYNVGRDAPLQRHNPCGLDARHQSSSDAVANLIDGRQRPKNSVDRAGCSPYDWRCQTPAHRAQSVPRPLRKLGACRCLGRSDTRATQDRRLRRRDRSPAFSLVTRGASMVFCFEVVGCSRPSVVIEGGGSKER